MERLRELLQTTEGRGHVIGMSAAMLQIALLILALYLEGIHF